MGCARAGNAAADDGDGGSRRIGSGFAGIGGDQLVALRAEARGFEDAEASLLQTSSDRA